MTAPTSRTGKPLLRFSDGVQGVQAGQLYSIEDHDEREHHPAMEGIAWERLAGTDRVIEYAPEPGSGAAKDEPEPVAEPEPDPVADEPSPGRVPPPTPGEAGLKHRYEKALRGRIGYEEGQLTPAEFVLLFVLLTYASEDLTDAYPGNARLAADCGIGGKGAAKRAGKRAGVVVEKGFAVVTRHGSNASGNVSQAYRLKLPEWP